ncbi:SRPBCC domain-containing protein [Microlunatus sp. GCM10028923]|uniref:SRPBCC family protein n=1 Tax=Microlunatus sp. GCM10028923 TaxID=3273400 RepID=UPI003609A1F4
MPGTPEQVWQAIATGPGQAAWLFPADLEPEVGGSMIIHREPFGPDGAATVTRYEPPHAFGYDEPNQGPPSPMATEILVEARSGGSCVVRVICGFADAGEEWEDLVQGVLEGWRMSLVVLAEYLRSFAGRPGRSIDVITMIDPAPADRTTPAADLFRRLGLDPDDVAPGSPFRTAPGAPELTGVVVRAEPGYLLLRSESPGSGLWALSCFPMGMDQPISINLMGRVYDWPDDQSAELPTAWRTWLQRQAEELAASESILEEK